MYISRSISQLILDENYIFYYISQILGKTAKKRKKKQDFCPNPGSKPEFMYLNQ